MAVQAVLESKVIKSNHGDLYVEEFAPRHFLGHYIGITTYCDDTQNIVRLKTTFTFNEKGELCGTFNFPQGDGHIRSEQKMKELLSGGKK